ncbi:MAG: gluconokinase [Sciscionella sp.]
MGVSGSGKTTVGKALADALDVDYAEADAFHSAANVSKMSSGEPLTDQDRGPWLDAIAGWIGERSATGGVVSSSALKRQYRDRLRVSGAPVCFLRLDGPRELIAERIKTRSGHFMPASLLGSQLADLEPFSADECGFTMDIRLTPAEIVSGAVAELQRGGVGWQRTW